MSTPRGCAPAHLRAAVVADARRLAHLHVDVWEDAYSDLMPRHVLVERRAAIDDRVQRWHDILTVRARTPDSEPVWLAEDPTGLVGFGCAGAARDDDETLPPLELTALYVRARCWGTGLGPRLLGAAVGEQAAYLWVLAGNERATRFYERHGFVLDGAVDDSDPHGRHLRMVRR